MLAIKRPQDKHDIVQTQSVFHTSIKPCHPDVVAKELMVKVRYDTDSEWESLLTCQDLHKKGKEQFSTTGLVFLKLK